MHKSVLIIAALAAHGVWVEQANIRLHRRNKKQKQQIKAAEEAMFKMQTLVGYLSAKLDEAEVELDEFDLIAIANI